MIFRIVETTTQSIDCQAPILRGNRAENWPRDVESQSREEMHLKLLFAIKTLIGSGEIERCRASRVGKPEG